MSGGHYDYLYLKIYDTYHGDLCDQQLEDLLFDFCTVLRALEWWQSCDYSEKEYRDAVDEFKNKWMAKDNRVCYPIKITEPGLHYRTNGGYYDPTRNLLFTAFISGELAEQLGIKWQREEEQHGPQ